MDKDAARQISSGRLKLMIAKDGLMFFAGPSLRLRLVEGDHFPDGNPNPTAGCDGEYLYYNAEYLKSLGMPETIGLLCHEVMHPLMGHNWRRGNRDPLLWNIACDYAINGHLINAGVKLPEGGLYDPKYDGMSAEAIYNVLPKDILKKLGISGVSKIGVVLDGKKAASEGDAQSGLLDPETEWQMAARQSAEMCRKAGTLPGSLEGLIGELTKPKVNWKAVTAEFVQKTVNKKKYSWSRPNKRYIPLGIYIPSLMPEYTLPEVVLFNDTSGSCFSPEYQTCFLSQINHIFTLCTPEKAHVVSGDTRVTGFETYERGEPVSFKPKKGGGGTDFTPLFEEVDRRGIRPVCGIFFTDTWSISFPEKPDYPVLWIVPDSIGEVTVPFGEIVRMRLD